MKKNNNPPLVYDEIEGRFKNKGLKLITKQYKNNHQLLDCEDDEGYKFNININNLDKFTKKKIVYTKNKWSIYNINKYIENNNINIQLVSQQYKGSKCQLSFRCKCGKIFYKSWDDFYSKRRYYCKNCLKKDSSKKLKFNFVKQEFAKYDLRILDKEYKANNASLLCQTKDGYLIKKSFINRHSDYKKNIFSYKNNKENYIYNVNNYFKLNNINCECIDVLSDICGEHGQHYLQVICDCGREFKTTIDYIKNGNYRCSCCTKIVSNGEEQIEKVLNKYCINHQRQYKFKNCKYKKELPFDFYLPDYNICIEFDGIYHYKKQPHVTNEQFQLQKERDNIKNEYCKSNNIKLIRIPYYQRNDIEKIILRELPLRINES